jgi:class 3 adenylate cyclase
MKVALARHDTLMRQAIELHSGYIFKTVGDAFCAAFAECVKQFETTRVGI